MDAFAQGELLKALMANDVMGGGRQFLANSLLFLEPEELKNWRQVLIFIQDCLNYYHNQH